jgi:hypothetical protein
MPTVKRIIMSLLSGYHTIKINLLSIAIALFLAIIHFSANAARTPMMSGRNIVGAVVVFKDISQRKKHEKVCKLPYQR